MAVIKVKYIIANDISGRYRWWTSEMEQVGQFEHADSMDEITEKAQKLVIVDIQEAEDDS